MTTIHEIATITSKGQITLPKSIRQALGVSYGGKVVFDLKDSQVVVSGVDSDEHEDPAIGQFLMLLEQDIQNGKNLTTLPGDLVAAMENYTTSSRNTDIEGDVSL